VTSMSYFPAQATFVHVKGHQDHKVDILKLSLFAKLNMEADTQAGNYCNEFSQHRPIIPLSPTRPVGLDIAGITIHRGFKQDICDAIHAPHLVEGMQV
jgi:hypothetical protein